MKMYRYPPIGLFYKKYKCSFSTETYVTAIFYKAIFERMASLFYNKLTLHGSKYAIGCFQGLNTFK